MPTAAPGAVRPSLDARQRAEVIHQTAAREWFQIENKAKAAATGHATIRIFDEIGFFGTSASAFVEQLDELDVRTIDLHINSPGGEVWDGIAIMNSLRAHPAKVTTIVDGVAASIASAIAIGAGDEVVMAAHSELMIHDAWGLVVGNADDMAKMLEFLNQESDNVAAIYAEKAGGSTEDWRAVMKAETWYSAEEAVEAGLADRVIEKPGADEAKNRFDLRIFNYAGRAKAPAPVRPSASAAGPNEQEATMPEPSGETTVTVNTPAAPETESGTDVTVVHAPPPTTANPASETPAPTSPPAAPAPGVSNNQEGAGMQIDPARLREAFGLPEAATDEEVRAAVVASGFASFTPFDQGGPQPTQIGQPVRNQGTPKGVVMIDASILGRLRKDAAAGQEAFSRLTRQERDQTIATAINEGKFAPARREHWEKAWDKDPEGTKQAIKDLSKGLVPVTPAGYSVDPEGKTAEDELYSSLFGAEQGAGVL
jgi:ATP-dependent Clp endopeptidase proteolytic subunit ClpP